MTTNEKRHLEAVASLCCVLCARYGNRGTPAQIHHIRTGVGMGRRASHYETIPLCHEHHQGATGIHGMGRKAWERFHSVTELELLEEVTEKVQHCLTHGPKVVSYA